jgi:hypothetical protein
MKFYWLILGVLTVWRISHLLHGEDGPWNIVVHLREAAGSGFWGKLLDCFHCLSIWTALPVALTLRSDWLECFLLWLALSAGAILLERITHPQSGLAPLAHYREDPIPNDVLLRPTKTATPTDEPDSPST